MRILVLYNEPVLPREHPDAESEHEILFTVDAVAKTLADAGHDVKRLGVSRDPSVLLSGLKRARPDVVFNLFEGLADHYGTEAHAAGILDWLGIPYTGSPYQTLCQARNKPLTKLIFRGAKLPTPDFFMVDEAPVERCPLEWPVIVKPGLQDASVGLSQESVVTNLDKLNARVEYLLKHYGPPVLVEQFIDGREFSMGVVEAPDLKVLPASEILFEETSPGWWPIVTYDAKWTPGSLDYEGTPVRYPDRLPGRLRDRLSTLARQAFRLLGCRDYARVDFRVTRGNRPYVLEVNPNPDFSPIAGLAIALHKGGLSHESFTLEMVHNAAARGGSAPVSRTAEVPAVSATSPPDTPAVLTP